MSELWVDVQTCGQPWGWVKASVKPGLQCTLHSLAHGPMSFGGRCGHVRGEVEILRSWNPDINYRYSCWKDGMCDVLDKSVLWIQVTVVDLSWNFMSWLGFLPSTDFVEGLCETRETPAKYARREFSCSKFIKLIRPCRVTQEPKGQGRKETRKLV